MSNFPRPFFKPVSPKPRPIHKGHTRFRARGAGSINAESDMRQLLYAGLPSKAAELYARHKQMVGARPMTRFALWYALYMQRSGHVQLEDRK